MKIKNLKRKMRKGIKGGMTTYVMLLFGMIVILYLFGFTNAWDSYTQRSIVNEPGVDENLTSPQAIDRSMNIGDWMINGIKAIFIDPDSGDANWLAVIGAGIATLLTFGLAKLVGGQYAFAFIIPIVLIVIFANIFIFPIASISGQMHWIGVIPLDLILIVFLNLFLFLSIIEFVRGTPI